MGYDSVGYNQIKITKKMKEKSKDIKMSSNAATLCLAKTKQGTLCQKPYLKGKSRCRLHGGLSTGPKTAEGKARIVAAHWKHGRRSREFTEARKQIWIELRAVEARMRADGII